MVCWCDLHAYTYALYAFDSHSKGLNCHESDPGSILKNNIDGSNRYFSTHFVEKVTFRLLPFHHVKKNIAVLLLLLLYVSYLLFCLVSCQYKKKLYLQNLHKKYISTIC